MKLCCRPPLIFFKGFHAGGEKVEVGYISHKLQVVYCQEDLGVLVCENVGSDGGAEYYPPNVPLPGGAATDPSHIDERGTNSPNPRGGGLVLSLSGVWVLLKGRKQGSIIVSTQCIIGQIGIYSICGMSSAHDRGG